MSDELKIQRPAEEGTTREVTRGGVFYRPTVDILETEDELLLEADMPGTKAEDVSIDFESGTLTIHGAVSQRQPREMPFLLKEYGVGDFHREFLISEDIDSEKISAEYRDGVLIVHLPKAERARPRKISVRSS